MMSFDDFERIGVHLSNSINRLDDNALFRLEGKRIYFEVAPFNSQIQVLASGGNESIYIDVLDDFLLVSAFSMCSGVEKQSLSKLMEEIVTRTIADRRAPFITEGTVKKEETDEIDEVDLSVGLNLDLLD